MSKDFARGEEAMRRPDTWRGPQYDITPQKKPIPQDRTLPSWENRGPAWEAWEGNTPPPIPEHLKSNAWANRYSNAPNLNPETQPSSKDNTTPQPEGTLVADRRTGNKDPQKKATKVPDGFNTTYVVHPGRNKGEIILVDEATNAVYRNAEMNPLAIHAYTDGFHGYIWRDGKMMGPYEPGQTLPTLRPGDKLLKRQPPGQTQGQDKPAQAKGNPYEKMPYGDKLTTAMQMVPGMLEGDAKVLFHQLTTDPKFAAALAAGAGAFAALQFTPAGPAINAAFMVAFGFKSGFELGKFFYEAFQAKDEAGIKAAAESLKNAIIDGGPLLISGLAGGLKSLTGLLTKLQGGKNASQTAAALSQLRPQQVAQFEKAIALRNAGKADEADAILGQLRSALGENNFREIEAHILARLSQQAAELEKTRIVRQDDDFSALINYKGKPKSRIDDSGSIVPTDPQGKTSVIEHIYGFHPAKSQSPLTSFMIEKNGVAKVYGSQEVELNISRLRADIKSGKIKDVEILTPKEISKTVRAEVEKIAPGVDLNKVIAQGDDGIKAYVDSLSLSKTKSDKMIRLLRAYLNTTRDGEFLIKGVIPKDYYSGPYPTRNP